MVFIILCMFMLGSSYDMTSFFLGLTVVSTLLVWYNPYWEGLFIGHPYRTYYFGEWYRCVTHGFMHGGLAHLFFNMYTLACFGRFVEGRFGYVFGWMGAFFYALLYVGGYCGG